MKTTSQSAIDSSTNIYIKVRHSDIHGNGVFAARKIPEGTRIIEYTGARISNKEADKRAGLDPDNPHHTFFFSLESGKIIDGGDGGGDARWINHSCAPNCEAQEEGKKVFIHALTDIKRGEELSYDYGLVLDDKITKSLKKDYACYCGADECRQTMLSLAKKKKKKTQKTAKKKD